MAQVLLDGLSDVNGIIDATRVGVEFSEEGMESEGVWGSRRMVSGREELLWEGIHVVK